MVLLRHSPFTQVSVPWAQQAEPHAKKPASQVHLPGPPGTRTPQELCSGQQRSRHAPCPDGQITQTLFWQISKEPKQHAGPHGMPKLSGNADGSQAHRPTHFWTTAQTS